MLPFRLLAVAAVSLVALEAATAPAQGADPLISEYLESGRLTEGQAALEARLKAEPGDAQAQFSLGVVQFLDAVEGLAQSQYRYGLLQHRVREVPFMRLPVPPNAEPEQISYADARTILLQFVDGLKRAEATLSKVNTANVKLPLHFGRIRLDLDGNGEATDEETLWRIYTNFNRQVTQETGEAFAIAFDGGDVHWLRGYCHLLMGLGEFALAHDWQDLFERTGHLFYPRVKTAHAALQQELSGEAVGPFDLRNILDVIAFVHLINFEVAEPERSAAALAHFEAMAEQSRQSWQRILAETDDDREWLPNPQQTGVIPGVAVSREMIDGWVALMDEMDAIFQGRKLLPYWRGEPARERWASPETNREVGINLRRVFTEPQGFDLVMWLQGTAATPYLESYAGTGKEGIDGEVFERLLRVFQGQFVGFALWFN